MRYFNRYCYNMKITIYSVKIVTPRLKLQFGFRIIKYIGNNAKTISIYFGEIYHYKEVRAL